MPLECILSPWLARHHQDADGGRYWKMRVFIEEFFSFIRSEHETVKVKEWDDDVDVNDMNLNWKTMMTQAMHVIHCFPGKILHEKHGWSFSSLSQTLPKCNVYPIYYGWRTCPLLPSRDDEEEEEPLKSQRWVSQVYRFLLICSAAHLLSVLHESFFEIEVNIVCQSQFSCRSRWCSFGCLDDDHHLRILCLVKIIDLRGYLIIMKSQLREIVLYSLLRSLQLHFESPS